MTIFIVYMIIAISIGAWNIFEKAGIPGWKVLIPVYNDILYLRLIGRPLWWLFLLLVPLVNIVMGIILSFDLAERFDKDMLFGAGLVFLPFIFYPILGMGSARYYPPSTV